MRCTECDSGTMREAEVEISRKVAGHTFTAIVRGQACGACGEPTFASDDVRRFEAGVARALAGSPESSGEAFRFMRKVAGLRAIDVAELFAVTPETISRWETDKHPIDRGALVLLGLIVKEKADGTSPTLDALRARLAARPLAKKVPIKLAS